MRGRRMRISRMKHQRQTHGLERRAGDLRTRVRRGRRHLLAEHVRERHAGALEHRTVAQDAALAAAAFRPRPGIAPKFRGVDRFHGRGDAVMQVVQVALDRGCVHVERYGFFLAELFLALVFWPWAWLLGGLGLGRA